MKGDKETVWLYILISFFQGYFFKYVRRSERAFPFILGIKGVENEEILYMDICVSIVPILFIILLFLDEYSFYMENYGRLLMIRRCKKYRMLGRIFGRVGLGVVGMVGLNILVQLVFYREFFIQNIRYVCEGALNRILLFEVIAAIEILLCTFLKEKIIQIILDIYIILSCMIYDHYDAVVTKILLFPGYIVQVLEEHVQFFTWRNGIEILVVGCCFAGAVIRCNRKDYY